MTSLRSVRAASALGALTLALLGGSLIPVSPAAGQEVAPPDAPGTLAVPDDVDAPPELTVVDTADPPAPNTVTAHGAVTDFGPAPDTPFEQPLVGGAPTPSGQGYWLVASDGGVFAFGDAAFYGSTGDVPLNQPIVGMAATPTGRGYWLVASDGGIFSFGDARFFGSTGGIVLNQPIVGMAATSTGRGYWLVASDGGIFSFGDAIFYGSTGDVPLNQPIVGMAATPTGRGYWLVASDGGIFAFGDATFLGSTGAAPFEEPVVGIAPSRTHVGYWLADASGRVVPFGLTDHGSADRDTDGPHGATVAILPADDGYWLVHGDSPVLDVSDSGRQVVALQQRLTDLGYWLGTVDGAYGTLTRQAVMAFQKFNGLPVTGQADPATHAALAQATRPVARSTSGDLIEIDKTHQVVLVVRGGRTQWVFNTSTGTEGPYVYEGRTYLADTPPGRFRITRQIDGMRVSHLGRLYRPKYFNGGIALHGSTSIPAYPASHGCVRLTNAAMDFFWSGGFAEIGTPVWVYGVSPGTPGT